MKKIFVFLLMLAIVGCKVNNVIDIANGVNELREEEEKFENTNANQENETDYYENIVSKDCFIKINNYEMNTIFSDEAADFSGVILFSRESCSFCQQLIPVVSEFLKANDKQIYYVDTHSIKFDETYNDEIGFKNVSEYIQELLKAVGAPIDEEGKALLRIPLIVAYNDGFPVKARLGVLPNYNNPEISLTEDERNNILNDLNQLYLEIKR